MRRSELHADANAVSPRFAAGGEIIEAEGLRDGIELVGQIAAVQRIFDVAGL
jgi:hypothetical protein